MAKHKPVRYRRQIKVSPEVQEKLRGVQQLTHDLSPTSMVVLARPKDMSKEDFYDGLLEELARDLLVRYGFSIAIVGVEHMKEMAVLDKDAMRTYGWIHIDDIDAVIEERISAHKTLKARFDAVLYKNRERESEEEE